MLIAKEHFIAPKLRDFGYFCDLVTKFGYAVTQYLITWILYNLLFMRGSLKL